MNPSTQFSLNRVDLLKTARFLAVQLAGMFVTFAVPHLLSFTYVYEGVDYTAYVLIVVNSFAELARRFVAGAPKV